MIVFENEDRLYTELAQNYLKTYIEIFDDLNENIDEKKESFRRFFPPLVYLENTEKCIMTFLKIGEWAKDNFYHRLGSLEKFVIYNILDDIDEEIASLGKKDFCDIYLKKSLDEVIEILKERFSEEIYDWEHEDQKTLSNQEIFDFYISGEWFNETLFEDFDEYDIDLFVGNTDESLASIDEYFYDVLPDDIINRIKEVKKQIGYSIDDFVIPFKQMIEKSVFRIYGFEHYLEKDFQILFEFYARSFHKISLEFNKVYREVEIGNGKIDFIINFPLLGDVLFELKMDRRNNVEQAILFQIPEYLETLKKDKAYIIIFSETEDNSRYVVLCEKVYKEKKKNIYPFMINIGHHISPSQKRNRG